MSNQLLEFLNIDYHRDIVPNPTTTFYARLSGDDLKEFGFHHHDLLIVDRSQPLRNNCFAIFSGRTSFKIKRVKAVQNRFFILPFKGDRWCPIEITESREETLFGVVHYVVRKA